MTPIRLSGRQAELLEQSRNGILATIRRDGRPQLTPVWFLWDGAGFWISTSADTAKARNIHRDQRVVLCIDGEAVGMTEYVQVDGTAAVVESDIEGLTLDLIRRYVQTEREALDHWARIRPGRILIRIAPRTMQWRGMAAASTIESP